MSDINVKSMVTIFKNIAKQIQDLNDEDLENVFEGKVNIQLKIESSNNSNKEKKQKISEEQLQQLSQNLRSLNSREEGLNLLKENLNTKDELTELAKFLDLNLKKNETNDQIRYKLVESTIGFRLRSAAIQGTSLESTITSV